MNLGSKKTILKACSILQIISFVAYLISFITILPNIDNFYYIAEMYNIPIYINFYILLPLHFCLFVIIYGFCLFYFNKKFYQNKENYYKNTIILKILSILMLFFDIIIAILLIVCAFSKDDNKDEEPQFKRKKHNKNLNLDNETKKQINLLKTQKRKGLISQELYEKKYNELLKNKKTF